MRVHWSFWLVGVAALLWHGMSTVNLVMQLFAPVGEAGDAGASDPLMSVVANRPFWATFAFVLSAMGGVLGAVALLRRHRICGPLFFVSFIGTLFTVLYLMAAGAMGVLNVGMSLLVLLAPVAFGFFLIAYTHKARTRGWLKRETSVAED